MLSPLFYACISLCLPLASAYMLPQDLPPLPLPAGINSSYVDTTGSCGLVFHTLSAGHDALNPKPLILLLHGAPELAFTWRHIIEPLASQGYHVVAPDQRGYGRTTGWDDRPFDTVDLTEFHMTNLVRDLVCLVDALGYEEVHSIISHDFGTLPGTYAPLIRPDIFKSSIQVSIPFAGPALAAVSNQTEKPPTVLGTVVPRFALLEKALEKLDPPRKHYQWDNSQPPTASDWLTGDDLGLKDFFRGYFYLKSRDWAGNAKITPPKAFTAEELAVMPEYLVLPLQSTMPEVVQKLLKGEDSSISKAWLSDADLDVFVSEYQRTGFQGELNWYRVLTSNLMTRDTLLLGGGKITVPTTFITGAQDWSSYLVPGSIEKYNQTCTDFRGMTTIEGAGHWVQEEQPMALLNAILGFLKTL